MFEFLVPLATTIIGGLMSGAQQQSAQKKAAEEQRRLEAEAKKPKFKQLERVPAGSRPPVQLDTGSRLAQQDPAVRSQALDALRTRMNQGA